MPLETINLLIGAGIALVASILTAMISHILQSQTDQQKRKWEIEDKFRQRQYEIEKERLSQAEEWAEDYVKFMDETRSRLITLAGKLSDATEFKKWATEVKLQSHILT